MRVFLGHDVREWRAWNIARFSLTLRAIGAVTVERVSIVQAQASGLYTRPTSERGAGLWDDISDAPMSTGHAIARFLVPHICEYNGLALFADGDVLFRAPVDELFALADPRFAVQVVKHQYAPAATVKMDGQAQTRYGRKNWSSVMLFNCAHPANRALNLDLVNRVPGRDLHRFCWLDDDQIGALPVEWNYLVGHSSPSIDPDLVHFTEGVPDMAGYEHCEYADEWYEMARECGYRMARPAKPEEAVGA